MKQSVACLVLAVGVAGLPGGPAVAESRSFPDGLGTPGPMDIHRVTVVNEKRLQVRIRVENLQKKGGRSASAWLDTDPERKGPEFFIGSGLYDSDWQISPTEGWKVAGDPLGCVIDQRLRYKRNVISWTTGKGCLGKYTAVRVSAQTHQGSTNDFSPAKRKFHPWVERY